ncbi:hypothetical protein TRFO_16122 [Tritrichomonas foetus]|uniref:Piezo non-specific cation channel cap domain-containing protein n=1 Tax=Tritrichomonas foetus TaxID=1144522 RepID=A0A1J4KR03_9EUKA|nr:hypothetical protein TRFO_16122 [Tritrichomonas foetus]|eukprot:OHT13687.1 hypothetical protein TRFO_16122 [Tritrichomonas foetus]
MDDFSSDPLDSSSTELDSTVVEDELSDDKKKKSTKKVSVEKVKQIKPKKTSKAIPVIHIIFSEILIPLFLIFSAIISLSIVGMVIIFLFLCHVLILSFSNKKTTGIKVILVIELLIFLSILVFAVITKIGTIELPEIIFTLGYDLITGVSSTPDFGLATGIIGVVFVIVDIALISIANFKIVIKLREKVFSSPVFQSVMYLLWYLCLSYIGASISTYLFAPLLLFFVYTNISHALAGRPLVHRYIQRIIYIYSVLYSMFIMYQISPISSDHPIPDNIQFYYISPTNLHSLLGVFAVLFAYISLMLLISPPNNSLPVHNIMKKIASIFIVITFVSSMVLAMFYPCLLSIIWVFIPVTSSIMPMQIVKKVFYKLHTVLYTLSFFAIIVSHAKEWTSPTDLMYAFGLFRYTGDFTFICCGYFLAACLGQLGLFSKSSFEEMDESTTSALELNDISNEKRELKDRIRKSKINKEKQTYSSELNKGKIDQENKDHEEEEEERESEDPKKIKKRLKQIIRRQKMHDKRKKLSKKLKTVIIPNFLSFLNYIAIAAIVIISITAGFYKDRWTLQVIFALMMIITILNFFFKFIFILFQLLMGILIIANIFFVAYPYNFSTTIPYFYKTGLCTTNDISIPEYIWPVYTLFALLVFVNAGNKELLTAIPPFVASFLFVLAAILHFVYVFVYETNIFTLLYVLIGIGMLSSALLRIRKALIFTTMLSSIFVAIQLVILMFSHFDSIRNLVCSIIPYTSIIDIGEVEEPSIKVAILGLILFSSSIALRSKEPSIKTKLTMSDHIFFEIKMISRNFYFYICWIFVFGFSVVNGYPTFLKFLMSCLFILGKYASSIFDKIRVGFLLFSIVYLGLQIAFHVFHPFINGLFREYSIYLGLFLDGTSSIQDSHRNRSIAWQIAYILIAVINIRKEKPRAQDDAFEELLPVRIYNAFCALLHNLLPVIVQLSLCISCLSNPSIFGYISYVVLLLVVFMPKLLQQTARIFTILFNICFIIQYLLWLKCPTFLFDFSLPGIINKWGRFLGIVDVTTSALISNCISQIIFTFYVEFRNLFVDYDQRFDALPDIIKQILSLIIGYNFEIFMAIIVVILSSIPTVDGFFCLVLVSCLLTASLLYQYPYKKTVDITSYFTFFVFGARMISRIPIFTSLGVGEYAQQMFDLPFQGSSSYEGIWIIVFIFERFLVHFMDCDLYHSMCEINTKHQAYRYIHSRQIKVIEQLDQEVCLLRHNLDIQQVESMNGSEASTFLSSTGSEANLLLEQMENKSMHLKPNESNKIIWYQFLTNKILIPVVDYCIETVASIFPPLSEAGINILTLETITILLKKNIHSLEVGKRYVPEANELQFFEELPPSFKIQFDSIGEIFDFKPFEPSERWMLAIRYIFAIIRRLAFPFLILIVLIYTFMKPYIFAMFLIIYVVAVFCSCRLKNEPNFYRIFLIMVMIILCFRCLSTINIINQYIVEAENNITLQKMSIDIFSLFGINPNDSSTIEVFVFLGAIWYIVDQLSYSEVFESSFYHDKFSEILPGFPIEYCYGIISNPANQFAMNTQDNRKFLKKFIDSITRYGLDDTTHKYWLLLLDSISLLVLAVCWTKWTTPSDGIISSNTTSGVVLTVAYVFMLFIHVLFMLVDYFASVCNRYYILFISHNLWFIYTILISFYYVQSVSSSKMMSSLEFYFVLRFLSHLIASHKCMISRTLSVFKYPDFVHHYNLIIWKNRFMRYCPFAFEIQIMLEWISKKTFVSLIDYFIVNNIKSKLEIKVAQTANPNQPKKYHPQKRIVIATICLILIAAVVFIPLFIMIEGKPSTISNPPLLAALEIGITAAPPLYKSSGVTAKMTSSWQQELRNSQISILSSISTLNQNDLTVIDFPQFSSQSFAPTEQDVSILTAILSDSNAQLIPYIKFSFYFEYPTTSGNNQDVVYQVAKQAINWNQKQELLNVIVNKSGSLLEYFRLSAPTMLYATSGEPMANIPVTGRDIDFTFYLSDNDNNFFVIEFSNSIDNINFLNPSDSLRIVIYSEPVSKNGNLLSSSSFGGATGFYLIIFLAVAFALRSMTLGFGDDLWFDRMEQPQKLYRLSIAIELFRNAEMPEKEKDLTDVMIDTVRSHEMVIKLTSPQSVG